MNETFDCAAAIPLFQRAIKLDPDFATAYIELANCYSNLGESSLAAENMRKAFELPGRMSDVERLRVEGSYHSWSPAILKRRGKFVKSRRRRIQGTRTRPLSWATSTPYSVAMRVSLWNTASPSVLIRRSLQHMPI